MSNVRVAINVTSENKNLIENVIKKNIILIKFLITLPLFV
mgnify:CR=1 FL=1